MTTDFRPMRVILTRDVQESIHLVDAVIAGVSGPKEVWGDSETVIIPRSAVKFVQALPLITTGAAEAFGVTDAELALAASSHSGEPDHVEAVAAWLDRLGMSVDDLECGTDRPLDRTVSDDLFASGGEPGPEHNCCSGKHAAYLTIARHLGVDPAGYIEREHPVQALVTESLEHFTGTDLSDESSGLDGCGVPTFSLPLGTWATAMARFADPETLPEPVSSATQRLTRALADNPFWVSGTGRTEVLLAEEASEEVVLKTGAEGVFMGAIPGRSLGLALKARDGATRAADAAIAAMLEHLGIVRQGSSRSTLTNRVGEVVGEQFVEFS